MLIKKHLGVDQWLVLKGGRLDSWEGTAKGCIPAFYGRQMASTGISVIWNWPTELEQTPWYRLSYIRWKVNKDLEFNPNPR